MVYLRVLDKKEKAIYEDLMKGILKPIKIKKMKPPEGFEGW